MTEYSKGEVNRAGMVLRSPSAATPRQLADAITVLNYWRSEHSTPLASANNGLRSMCRTVGVEAQVSQRLKREQTIILKLQRFPKMSLSRMNDIAGCRAVVRSKEDLRKLEHQILRNHQRKGYKDYIEEPKPDGYRGVHLIVSYQGKLVEIQLRTEVMHDWAIAVEQSGALTAGHIKFGEGDPATREFFRLASEILAIQESGRVIPQELIDRHAKARNQAFGDQKGNQ